MDDGARSKCLNAIAHLKMENPESECENLVHVREQEAPVARSLGHGLLEMYFVDMDDRFDYVQKSDLLDAHADHPLSDRLFRRHGRKWMPFQDA